MSGNSCCAIIVAAGKGKRMNSSVSKQFMTVGGLNLLERSIIKFDLCEFIKKIIIVSSKENIEKCRKICEEFCLNSIYEVIEGGAERQDSVYNGINATNGDFEYVMIHDAARPFVDKDTIERVFKCVLVDKACIPAVPVKDTIKKADKNNIAKETLKRDELWAVQTPQAFSYDIIKKAYDSLVDGTKVTDDASVVELIGLNVKIVEGSYFNIKITTPEDLIFAEVIAEKENKDKNDILISESFNKINLKDTFCGDSEISVMKNVDIYTDGACSGNPGKGGYGVVLIYNGKRKELSAGYELTTNNRMELLSVIEALSSLRKPCNVTLYSDSKYVVDALNKGWVTKWEKNGWMRTKTEKASNSDLWIRLMPLLKKHNVKFVWVKGHNQNIENERCDELARNAIKRQNLAKDELYGC